MRLYERQVSAGIAYLNRQQPDWFWRINLHTLDLSDDRRCVLGQLRGNYADATDVLLCETGSNQFALGFSIERTPVDDPRWAPLTCEWKHQINVLRQSQEAVHASL